MPLDKRHLLTQLRGHYEQRLANAKRAELDAREGARTVATESEKKEDGRVAIELNGLANGQAQRQWAAKAELEQLDALCLKPMPRYGDGSKAGLLALVDVGLDHEDGEREERTFFVLPFGAGTELTGPGGDGIISVITPASPVGRAIVGKRAGDDAEIQLERGVCELVVLEVA
jgi:hypothetical protein